MPHIDGYELVRQVKKLNPGIKVILMSGFEFNESDSDPLNTPILSEIEVLVEKPTIMGKLSTIVLTILNNKTVKNRPNVTLLYDSVQ